MPVDTHLCQPGGGASCGACCGLYNFADHSRQSVTGELARHTQALRDIEKTRSAWRAAGEALVASRREAPLFSKVRVCPLLGFLDSAQTQVGCLAHPLVTGGTDLRDCGVYTAEICETFTCPSFSWLTEPEAQLVRAGCPDWYLYGLVITDVEFVRGCLKLLEAELAGPVPMSKLIALPAARGALQRLFQLKEDVPQRDSQGTVFGRFVDEGGEEPAFRKIDYAALGLEPSPADEVLLCAGAEVSTKGCVVNGREEIARRVGAVLAVLCG